MDNPLWYKVGIANMLDPDPFSRRRHQNGNVFLSGNGASHRNFELALSSSNATGFAHMSRDGDTLEWSIVDAVAGGSDTRCVGQPLITGTSFNRDIEVICRDGEHGLQQWTYSQAGAKWSSMTVAAPGRTDLEGYPGFVQADDSSFALVIRHKGGMLNEVSERRHHPHVRFLSNDGAPR